MKWLIWLKIVFRRYWRITLEEREYLEDESRNW
jgi:hypothetical protein